ncbi:putative homoserine dehydrogenase-like protein [Natronocella acetinitrilica]|uniref:Homoserine dehydrogenase-like protein n=1 Tax=Natronocella acetinitrilica TaxID=414046 RepID=A0AAE3KCQ2_9GAMM|nr:Gfo/Idh/MocA family oxidoreductase [Natronocella acetinitrilica]MCP1675273.1 putative homoserine dehydrogenase-like protein [Natronocella acetinitrilica]
MNLTSLLQARAAEDKPVRVGMVGAGKFGSMFLAQVQRTPGMHLLGLADLSAQRARDALERVGWPGERYAAADFATALSQGSTHITEDADALINADGLDVLVEATGNPAAGIRHARAAFRAGVHVVMVNVEADALAGPLLAREAAAAGVVYSLAYGDQPALICELVDWARATGFEVVAAGKGTKYLPIYHQSTPDTVWGHYGLSPEDAKAGGMNPQMFNSFLDGTKSGLEMAAVANAAGLTPPDDGLLFPACGVDDLPHILRPSADGGRMPNKGVVEVVSSIERDGRPVFRDLRWGVYVVFEAPDEYVRRCFREYGLHTDSTGRYAAMYKPYHLIGLELGISVASVALRGEPTGISTNWRGDVVATAKRDLAAGDMLDGEGGATVWGKLLPARRSSTLDALPIGLAHNMRMKRAVGAGEVVSWADVDYNADDPAIAFRREMEKAFGNQR